jgi:peptidoglycan/LPS O-acetylase OafA/YrhL
MGMVRVALALAVLLSHIPMASFKFLSGGLAVQSFFIVSGFYMSLVLGGKYRDTGLFYSNRLLRLFPTYLVTVILSLITLYAFRANAVATPELFATVYADPWRATLLVFQNLTLIGQEMLFWFKFGPDGGFILDTSGPLPSEDGTVVVAWQALLVPQAWSLSMELIFYALAPFLARLNWRWIAALAAASIGLRLSGAFLDVDYLLWQGRFFPTALFLFLLGMLGHRALPLVARVPKAFGWLAAALLLTFIVTYSLLGWTALPTRWIVYAVVALAIPFVFNAFKNVTIDRWIGDLSYPIYLSQLLVIGYVIIYEPPFALWIAIGGTMALSLALLVLVDHPVDRWRQARANRANHPDQAAQPAVQPA